MLAEARDWGYKTTGVELAAEIAEWGREHLQLDIRVGTLDVQHFPDHEFDVVFLGDVIEHLLSPREVLNEIRRVLTVGGILAMAFPMELNSIPSRIRSLLSLRKQSPHKPYHLYYYNLASMRRLLHQCGFEIALQRSDKVLRAERFATRAVDYLNYAATQMFGVWGDRGFVIARPVGQVTAARG